MFTGLVQKLGRVHRVSRGAGLVMEFAFEPWPEPLVVGESVAVNGVCLTVSRCDERRFTAEILRETEMRSSLGAILPGRRVNLERALRAGEALGGHLVQGHVECQGEVVLCEERGRDRRLRIRTGRVFAAKLLLKGSVAVDGVSLTITELGQDFFAVDLIPVTLRDTVLGERRLGDKVNLESDILVRQVAMPKTSVHELSFEDLARAGFMD